MKDRLDRDEIALIDVREPLEHARDRIDGAKLVPISKLDADTIQKLSTSDRPVVLHCRSGNRSRRAAQQMLDRGCDSVAHLAGGIEAWKSAGLPTIHDPTAPIDIMRQVQITAGSIILLGVMLGWLISPWFYVLSGFVGAGQMFAGISGTCGMAMLLAKMPWNRVSTRKS